MTRFTNEPEITRREFMQVVFATISIVAMSGAITLWPEGAINRPVSKPFNLVLDESNYLIDPTFDYCDIRLPTHREKLSLEGLKPRALKRALNEQIWEIEHLVFDTRNWTLDEIDGWLDTEIEYENLGAWQAASYSPHGAGLDIYNGLSRENARELGLELVEEEHPGSSFVGIAYYGDIEELNRQFEILGMNLIVTSI